VTTVAPAADAEQTSPSLTMSAALAAAIDCAMGIDPKIICLGEDIAEPIGGVFKTMKGLSTKYGVDRVRATPISEQAIIGAAIGASLGGYRPIAEIMFFDFTMVCADQLANHAAKLRYMSGGQTPVPITVCTNIGSGRFGAQHTQSIEAWFMHMPGMKVVMPSNPVDAKGLLLSCIFDDDPCLVIQHTGLLFGKKAPVPEGDVRIPLGVANTVRPGSDVSVITYGAFVQPCVDAAEELAAEGIDAEVIDLRTLSPLDRDTVIESAGRTGRAAVVHGATTFCGPGAEVAAMLQEELHGKLAAPVRRLGAPYAPIPFATELEVFPTAERIRDELRALVRGRPDG
jgi:acetoin:2,6-dichlorophenolindophenol oxidoreductase subunit beta